MNIFIDCGTHMFQGFEQVAEIHGIDDTWVCYSFEANPLTYIKSQDKYKEFVGLGYNITHINSAVFSKYGEIVVNCVTDNEDYGVSQRSNTLYDRHISNFVYHGVRNISKISVPSIDFSNFLANTVSPDDYVVVKMDIEGAEFYVLPKLIEDRTFTLIDKIYCEFHTRFFNEATESLKAAIINQFNNSGIEVEEWD